MKNLIFCLALVAGTVQLGWTQKANPAKYCTSGATTTAVERINSFTLKEIAYTNSTTCTTYKDLTTSAAGIAPGEVVTATLQLGACSGTMVSSTAKVFIDWNGDFDFLDAGETVYTTPSAVAVATNFPISFTVPTTATVGLTTMMRVVNQYNTTPGAIQSCGTFLRGETQDYTIQITLFSETTATVFGTQSIGAMKAGDFDNDGDLDLLVQESTPTVKLYRNNSVPGTLTLVNTGIAFPTNITPDGWLDFNNDGYLDLMAHVSNGAASVYLSNAGVSFTAAPMSFGTSIYRVDWADYDKDGDLDYLVDYSAGQSKLFRQQNDKTFLDGGGVTRGNLFFDYDNDNDYDVTDGQYIYTNVNNNFEQTHDLFPTNEGMSVDQPVWQDFDGDGDIDMAVIWRRAELGSVEYAYFKNNNSVFTRTIIPTSSDPGQVLEPTDLDHNGKLDLIVNPTYGGMGAIPQVYYFIYEVNASGNLVSKYTMPIGPTSIYSTGAVLGDFDKDGSVDFILAGSNLNTGVSFTRFYRNRTTLVNAAPSVPLNLTSTVTADQVKLTWSTATDDKTPVQSLSYNLEIRRGSDTLKFPMSKKGGSRKVIGKGNNYLNDEFNLSTTSLPQGLYSWSVQAIDQEQRPSAFAAEGTFELINQNYPLEKIANGTSIKSVYNALTHEYIVAYIQSGDLYYQKLDVRGQKTGPPSKLNLISTGCLEFDITVGLDNAEYFIVWVASNGAYAKRVVTGTTTAETLISDQASYSYQSVSAVYNPTAREYAGFFAYSLSPPTLSYLKGLQLTVTGAFGITKGALKTLNTITYNPSLFYQYHDDIAISFNKTFNCYVASWLDNIITDVAYMLNPNFVRFQLFSPTLTLYNTPVSLTYDYGLDLGMREQFQDKYLALWTEYDQFPTTGTGSNSYDYVYETRGTILELSKPAAIPLLTLKPIPFNLSRASNQGTLYAGSSGPSHTFNSKRNEDFMIWSNNGYLKFQRYDVVDAKLVLKDELRLNNFGGGKTNVSFNPDRNEFMTAWVNGADSYFALFKDAKDNLPLVTSADKVKAYAGEKVILTGDYFSKTNSLNAVAFGGIPAVIGPTYTDGKHLEVTVPDGLGRTPVPISISFDDQTGTSTFLFENLTLPSITATDKTEGEIGTVVTITGDKLTEDSTQYVVKFGSVEAKLTDIISSSVTEIKVKVPEAAVRGTGPLSITIQGQVVNAPNSFRVIIPPVITSVVAPEGFISCKTVTIKGTGFSEDPGQLLVKFGNVPATLQDLVSTTSTAILVTVPQGADGNVQVSVTVDSRTDTTAHQHVFLGSTVVPFENPKKIELTNHTTDKVNLLLKVMNNCSVEGARLWSKGISEAESAWTSVTLPAAEENRVEVSISEDKFKKDPIGLSFYYEVQDKSDSVRYSEVFNVYKQFTEFDSTNFVPSLVFGGSSGDYNIVSIPYDMNPNKVTSVFKDVFNTWGYDSSKWRIFHYLNDGATKKYVEYLHGLTEIKLGESYWIIIRYPQDIFFEGAQSVDLSQGPFVITLQPGWNQMGNPYNFNVSWQDIMTANDNPAGLESLKTFKNGSFQAGTVVTKFSGGFVRNNGTAPVALKIPFLKNASINSGRENGFSTDISSEQWQLPIAVHSSGLSNMLSKIGMHPDSEEGVDRYDEHVMPHFNRYLDLTFPEDLSASIIRSQESYTWEFGVATNTQDDDLMMDWDNTGLGSGDKQLYLYDMDQERVINMREVNQYSFRYDKSRLFKVYYGTEAYLREHLFPGKSKIGVAYPNPFSQGTKVPFTVSTEKATVHLGVYNLQGQEVSVIVNQELGKGFYETEWEGTNDSGQPLPSGTYLLRLQVPGQPAQAQKVILAK